MNDFIAHLKHAFQLPLQNPIPAFSLILIIILLVPVLLKKLNIPGIIGLIISGVIIGPYGLKILEKNAAIDLFSTIGLLYIMFIAGLELDMNEFKVNQKKSAVFGFFTFLIPISIGYPVCYYLLGYDFNASLLTASMFATHTLVAYPIVSKMGIAKNQAVAVTVGGTILTDTAVLLILAIIRANSHGGLNQEFWIRLVISLLLFAIIMFFVVPRIAKWFFQKMDSEKHAHYIFVLAVVFFAAFLAELAGVEPIIGAFMAGLALNRLIPHSSALMNRIEFMGNALFIPFFLIAVGMLVDMSVVLSGPTTLIIAGTLTLVAITGKWLAAWLTQISFKYSSAQRQLIFGLSSAHAAATLAIILVGYTAGILDENILNGTIVLILFTCVIASFATEKAAKKIVITQESDDEQIQLPDEFSRELILIPVAERTSVEKLVELAGLIKDKKSPNPLSVLSVVLNDESAEQNIVKARNKLEAYVKEASAAEVKISPITTIDHNAASGISRISREVMADIILVGWPQKTGFLNKLLGEKMDSIIHTVDKCLFIGHFEKPLVSNKRIIIITPPLAQYENGFTLWLTKIAQLARELSLPVIHYGAKKTYQAIQDKGQQLNLNIAVIFREFNDWEDFLILSKDIHADDLIVLVSSRKGAISYINVFDNISVKLEKYFEQNSKLMIYPAQYESTDFTDNFDEVPTGPLTKGLETIGRGIGQIFKKQKDN